MALADRVSQDKPKRMNGIPCSVGKLLTDLPPEESAALQKMLDSGWSQSLIVDALYEEGHSVGNQTPNRHRARACRCFK